MFLLFAGSPSLGEFLFLNLDIAQFGSNTKTIIKDENSMVMMISDETGEGKMTVHQILPGIMICFTDMHMEQCMSEFELNSGQKVLCIDPQFIFPHNTEDSRLVFHLDASFSALVDA